MLRHIIGLPMSGISNLKGPLYGTFSYTKVINQNPWSLTRVVFVTIFGYLGKNKKTNKQGAVNSPKDFLGKKQGPKSPHFKGEKKEVELTIFRLPAAWGQFPH